MLFLHQKFQYRTLAGPFTIRRKISDCRVRRRFFGERWLTMRHALKVTTAYRNKWHPVWSEGGYYLCSELPMFYSENLELFNTIWLSLGQNYLDAVFRRVRSSVQNVTILNDFYGEFNVILTPRNVKNNEFTLKIRFFIDISWRYLKNLIGLINSDHLVIFKFRISKFGFELFCTTTDRLYFDLNFSSTFWNSSSIIKKNSNAFQSLNSSPLKWYEARLGPNFCVFGLHIWRKLSSALAGWRNKKDIFWSRCLD